MANEITNSQIEEAFKNIYDDDVNTNFVGSFPSNHMNKFIDHASMISPKKGKYPFDVEILITLARAGLIGGVYLTLSQKQIFSFPIHLMLMAQRILLFRMIKRLLEKFSLGLIK